MLNINYSLMANSYHPYGRQACHIFEKISQDCITTKARFVCPICYSDYEELGGTLYCSACSKVYFTFDKIPILDNIYAPTITEINKYSS